MSTEEKAAVRVSIETNITLDDKILMPAEKNLISIDRSFFHQKVSAKAH
jgi:hypothetical protein